MPRAEALARVADASTGHLATVRPDGRPHLVVITFATIDGFVVTAIDHKPKKTLRLQRLANIEANPTASFLVDHYDDDWSRLWWVRVDGAASIHETDTTHALALEALAAKYPQYRERLPEGAVIAVAQEEISYWPDDLGDDSR